MTATFHPTWESFATANREALARVEAQLSPAELERWKEHRAEQELADIRDQLYRLAWELLRVMHSRIQPRA